MLHLKRSPVTIASTVNSVYNTETDLFAAYPLWIDTESVKSELSFLSTQSGQYISAAPARAPPVPSGPVQNIPTPSPTLSITEDHSGPAR